MKINRTVHLKEIEWTTNRDNNFFGKFKTVVNINEYNQKRREINYESI